MESQTVLPKLFIIDLFLFRVYNHNAFIKERRSNITYDILLKIPRLICYSNGDSIFFLSSNSTKPSKYAYSNYIP